MKIDTENLDSNYGATGFGNRLGFGKKPALIVIDLCEAYFREGSPLHHATYTDMVPPLLRVREAAHKGKIPVILTRVEYTKGGADGGMFFLKSRVPLTCMEKGNPLAEFHADLKPRSDEIILTKQYPSAFFASSLTSTLLAMGVDTVFLTGVSTSGCVRATAVDACSSGFRTMVIREACGDRHPGPHAANLFDIDAKYGDVVTEAETLGYFASLPVKE